MSFADRIIRMRRKAGMVKDPEAVYIPEDGVALAAEHINMSRTVEEDVIRWPRASALHDACMRLHVLGAKNGIRRTQHIGVRQKLLYGIGRAVQEWIQNSPDVLGNRRRGWWRCLACGKVVYFGGPPRKRCRLCNALPSALTYHEHHVRLTEPLYVTGHPDMYLDAGNDLYRILEIKTIKNDEFEKLLAPIVQHDWQLHTYMWTSQFDTTLPVKVDADVGYVMYVSKKYSTKELPYKMFTVNRNDALIHRIRTKLQAFADGFNNYPEDMPPPIAECLRGKLTNYRAKTCPAKDLCFKFYEEE